MHRLVGNGMDHDDAALLHAMTQRGVKWAEAAEVIGNAKLELAAEAAASRHFASARTHFWHAAAALRFAQSPLIYDEPLKVAIYRRAQEAFARGAALGDPPYSKLTIPFDQSVLFGWLMTPPGIVQPPVVIVFGGADGWREEYHNAGLALIERGIATLLLDGPGQGETRILGGLHLQRNVERAFSAAIRFLIEDHRVGDRIGIWGNSLGGCFAARAASSDRLISACCVNGGTWMPMEILTRFPRFIDRMRAMTGQSDPEQARALLDAHTLHREDNRIACPLLVLHGTADRLFSPERAQELAEWAPSSDKRFVLWEGGDHCVYDHTSEKHCLVADWFAAKLSISEGNRLTRGREAFEQAEGPIAYQRPSLSHLGRATVRPAVLF